MAITVTGVDELLTSLQQTGQRAERGVAGEIRQGAEDIKDLAVMQAPVDEGNLENAIKVEIDRSGIRGRVQAYVFVDGDEDAGDGKKVEEYANLMHEGVYQLGPRSQIKNAAVGGGVGRKFLERAVDELAPDIINRVRNAMKRILR